MNDGKFPAASVVIVTHNRDAELSACLSSLRGQSVPLDVIVMDDKGGRDTRLIVEEAYPGARYFHVASKRGPAFQRNRGVEAARCEFVVSLDDDTELIDTSTVERTLQDFDNQQIAAVGIPFINVRISDELNHTSSDKDGRLHAFVGAAHAVRRTAFLEVKGFREHFFYMGEEGDLCLRLLENGYTVKAGSAPPLHHFESPRRDSKMAARCGRKNDILFCWHNVPHPYFAPNLISTVINGVRFGAANGHLEWHIGGLIAGFRAIFFHRRERAPVSLQTFRTFRRLKRLDQAEPIAWQASIDPAHFSEKSEHD